MTLVVVRHATAGSREEWEGDDRLRPLDAHGLEQARRLPEQLAGRPIRRLVSSPYRRCVQTLEPLALARGLPIVPADELAEERDGVDGPGFLRALLAEDAVACVHGSIRGALGVELSLRKGAIWLFDGSLGDPQLLG